MPPGVDLAAYPIVQEALTNAVRHAVQRHAVVSSKRRGPLLVKITDDGAARTATPAGGHGLVGMRERVAVYGGSLEAGTAPRRLSGAAPLPFDEDRLA